MAEENHRYPANQEDLSCGKAPACGQTGSLVAQRSLLEASSMDMRVRIVQWPQFWLSAFVFCQIFLVHSRMRCASAEIESVVLVF